MMNDCSNIIDSLIERCHELGMTQQDLVESTRLTQSVIARMENKKVIPKLDTLVKVASALICEMIIIPSVSTK